MRRVRAKREQASRRALAGGPQGKGLPSPPAREPRVAIEACPVVPVTRRRRVRSPSGDDRSRPPSERLLLTRASAPTMRPLILTPSPLVSRGRRSNGKIFRLVKRFGFVSPSLMPEPEPSCPIRTPAGREVSRPHGQAVRQTGEPQRNQASQENLVNWIDLAGVNHQCDHGPPGLVSQGSPQEGDPLLATSRMRANQLAGWDPANDRAGPSGLRRSAKRWAGWPCVSRGSGATCSFYSSRTGPWV